MAACIPTPTFQFLGISRGNVVSLGHTYVGVARLPSDPIGTFILRLDNVVIGSTIQVETQAGIVTTLVIASDSTVVLNLNAYTDGSSANSLKIKVRKGSEEPFYRPWETVATSIVGFQSIYVSQIQDD